MKHKILIYRCSGEPAKTNCLNDASIRILEEMMTGQVIQRRDGWNKMRLWSEANRMRERM